MTPEQIQKMAEGFRPSCIGKDHEEVVVWLANHHIALQQQVNALTEKLDSINDYCIGVDTERMDYIEKFNTLAAENAELKKGFEKPQA